MQRLEVSGAVRPIYGLLGIKLLNYKGLNFLGFLLHLINSIFLFNFQKFKCTGHQPISVSVSTEGLIRKIDF